MRREDMADLTAFVVVAEARNFTRAAAKLGLSQSALSQIVRRLETRLGVRLLARTTRSVAATEAGDRLVRSLAPMLHDHFRLLRPGGGKCLRYSDFNTKPLPIIAPQPKAFPVLARKTN